MKLLVPILFLMSLPATARPADLLLVPMNPDRPTIHVIGDTHCPLFCEDPGPRCPDPPCADSIPCCDTFLSIVQNMNVHAPDLTMHVGDLILNSHGEPTISRMLDLWDQIEGERHFTMGNHEADPNSEFEWFDPENHYAPANWLEPLFGCDSLTALPRCRRWYSIYLGVSPTVAVFVVNNNSDELFGDSIAYPHCRTPNDSLNHAGSSQRVWLNAEIDSLPSSVRALFVLGHRTYYGVEGYSLRPNILYSGTGSGHHTEAPAETLRTGAVSFLRDLESVYDRRPNVAVVVMISGDQHVFAEVKSLRANAADSTRGVKYLTLGISGGKNDRDGVFPDLSQIPYGTLVHAFDDRWGYGRFEIESRGVTFSIHEAYTDTLLYETFWPIDPGFWPGPASVTTPHEDAGTGRRSAGLQVWPNPANAAAAFVSIEYAPPRAPGRGWVDHLAVYDVTGRLVRDLQPGLCTRTWDLRDDRGQQVTAGTYFVLVRAGGRTESEKVLVLE